METGKKTARQKFLRRSRALTLTISIPSLAGAGGKRSESVISLRRSQSSRDMFRHKLTSSASENCLDKEDEVMSDIGGGCVSVINVSSIHNNHVTSTSPKSGTRTGAGFGYRLKRSLTVSHIIDNLNKSFRVRRSSSQRDMAAKKNRFRRYRAPTNQFLFNEQVNHCCEGNRQLVEHLCNKNRQLTINLKLFDLNISK